jgi:hypothetical protein
MVASVRPPPIRTDTNRFASFSMRERVPAILDAAIDDAAPALRTALRALRDEIASGAPIRPLTHAAPDVDAWTGAVAARARETWLATDWYFAEAFLYRRVIEAARWWETARDPFERPKRDELAGGALWDGLERILGERVALEERLEASLWGNRIDLSYQAAAAHGTDASADHLLADDRAAGLAHLRGDRDVHVIADNAGSELAFDLALIDALLDGRAARVILHVKMHPTFVSDTIPADVWTLISAMEAHGDASSALGARVRASFDAGRLRIAPDPFWCSSAMFDALPPRIAESMAGAALVIAKGDANYRRLVNDAPWAPGVAFADAAYRLPAPVLALRTLKSDALAGVPAPRREALDASDPTWRVSGKYGVIQLAPAAVTGAVTVTAAVSFTVRAGSARR